MNICKHGRTMKVRLYQYATDNYIVRNQCLDCWDVLLKEADNQK